MKWMISALCIVAMLLGTLWLAAGCSPFEKEACPCSGALQVQEITLLDEDSIPVDSAEVSLIRTSDGKALALPSGGTPSKGRVAIFINGIAREFPRGKSEMEVLVAAKKGDKSGEQKFLLTTDECRCDFEVASGRDTLILK